MTSKVNIARAVIGWISASCRFGSSLSHARGSERRWPGLISYLALDLDMQPVSRMSPNSKFHSLCLTGFQKKLRQSRAPSATLEFTVGDHETSSYHFTLIRWRRSTPLSNRNTSESRD